MKMKPRNASGKIHKKYFLEALVKVPGGVKRSYMYIYCKIPKNFHGSTMLAGLCNLSEHYRYVYLAIFKDFFCFLDLSDLARTTKACGVSSRGTGLLSCQKQEICNLLYHAGHLDLSQA